MNVLGKNYDEKTVARYSNTMESIHSARRILLLDGKAKGTEAIEVVCSSGLELMILVDRGLDIACAKYKGVNIGFMSKNGITGRVDAVPNDSEFVHYFEGGLLTTCGLRNAGVGCREENGEYHPVHGRINTIPAQNVSIIWKDRETLEISGILRETALFGYQLQLHRTITVHTSEARISIDDVLENESFQEEEFMLLYHVNFGFPFLQDGCYVEFEPADQVTPRNEDAEKGLADHTRMVAPIDNCPEQVFFHMQKGDASGRGRARLVNPQLAITAELTQSLDTLPILIQWKCMRSGDYALGLEPANNHVKGRVEERKSGSLRKILPFEKLRFSIELKISDIKNI